MIRDDTPLHKVVVKRKHTRKAHYHSTSIRSKQSEVEATLYIRKKDGVFLLHMSRNGQTAATAIERLREDTNLIPEDVSVNESGETLF